MQDEHRLTWRGRAGPAAGACEGLYCNGDFSYRRVSPHLALLLFTSARFCSPRPVSALNGRAIAPGKCSESKFSEYSSVCVLCVQVCAAPSRVATSHITTTVPGAATPRLRGCAECCVRVIFRRASPRFAFCGLPHRDPRPPRPLSISFYHTTRPARRAVVASRHLRCCESVRQRLSTLAGTAMERKLQMFLTERGHFDLLREFEAYCASPASPDPQVVVFDPEMDLEYTLPKESKKRPAAARPSEGTSSDSDSDPGSSDSPDHSGFTTVRRRKAAKPSQLRPEASSLTQAPDGFTYFHLTPSSKKPKKANIAKATAPAKSTRSIYDSPVSWREPSQPTTASQGAVDAGKIKAAAPATAKNLSDKADVTAPPSSCTARPETTTHEDLLAQNLPVHSVRRILNRFREPLDLVLVSGTAEANDKATKAAFFKIRSVCSLSGVKAEQPRKRALPGQCHNCQSYGHSSRHCFHSARCVKCLGDHGTAQCTRNKDTDGPPACVLCKQKGHTANYLGCPRAPKRPPPPEKAVPRRAPTRPVSSTLSYARAAAGPRNAPPAAKNIATSADDLSQLVSIITVIDTSELAILAKKFRTAANPTEKLICLIEHASLVEAIKNKL
ncbi:Nucleic-acid-binding protein from transposon X-element [Eumeta japonica]|uniref:Nucleic-acid-binding protein from transposon X-element n=1 Tax=Eumeta variegata TaxID=151549 RepID=A0A4C1XCE9_EUMVA|nr:Nucleic-acid-binding protein from transposon X-element [Eumeta japonica]